MTDDTTNLMHMYLCHLRQAQTYGREIAKLKGRDKTLVQLAGVCQTAMGQVLAYAKRWLGADGWQQLDDASAVHGDLARWLDKLPAERGRMLITFHEFLAENARSQQELEALIKLFEQMVADYHATT